MSILDTISTLNQEASVRASSGTEKGAADEPTQLTEEDEQNMIVDEEGNSNQEATLLEEAEEVKVATAVQAADVKMESMQEQAEVGKELFSEEVKMEEEESGVGELTEEKTEKNTSIDGGKLLEEQPVDETIKSTSQAKEKAREKIKEGELLCLLFFYIVTPTFICFCCLIRQTLS